LSDFAVPDYFLWGYVKSKIYETHPAKINDKTNSGVYLRNLWTTATACDMVSRMTTVVLSDIMITYVVSIANSDG
jgi:hypothetical protein